MFGGRRGSGWGAAAVVLGLFGTALPAPAPALVIDPTYDSTVSSNANAAQIEASFNTIIAQFEALYVNPVTVNVTLHLEAGSFLGENDTVQATTTYSTFRTDLSNTATANNTPAMTALGAGGSLPNQTTVPVNSGRDTTNTIQLSAANARALGISANPASDATLLISNSFPIQFSRVDGQIGIDNYDFVGAAEHELDEILGLGSALVCNNGGAACPDSMLPSTVRPEDLLRYDQNGARSFTFSSAALAFASINNGSADLIQLNQDFNGDYGDFFSRDFPGTTQDQNAPCVALVQNAFSCNGQVSSVGRSSVETQLLAAMGWNPRFSTAAASTVWLVNCTAGTIASSGAVVTASTPVTNPLGTLLGSPSGKGTFATLPIAGDTIEITGICVEDVTVSTSGLTITDHEGPDGTAADTSDADGVQGQIEIAGAQQIVISGLSLGNFSGAFSFNAAADLATLFVHDGAMVVLLHTDVANSPSYGVLVRRQGQISLLDDRVFFSGFNSGFPGVAVLTNAKAVFGADDGSLFTLVQGSGGDGVVASIGSSVIFHAAQLTTNGGRQLHLQGTSSARLSGSGVTIDMGACQAAHAAACAAAIEATGSSTLRIEQGATVTATDSGSVVAAIAVNQGSSVLLQGATIKAQAGAPATVSATENSVIALAGGNMICAGTACDNTATGTAIVLDHVSTLIQVPPTEFGYSAAQDALFGSGSVQLQSTVDLGLGTIGGGGPPSLAWTTPSSAAISVAQNSSFRLSGGVSIAGTGGVKLSQGSNGFFTLANGGTNTVAGTVICPFVAVAASHVIGNTAVSPNVAVAHTFDNASSPQCLPF
jgi:hypothetical protein